MATISIKKVSLIAFSLLSFAATTTFAGETDNKLKKLQSQMDQTRAQTPSGNVGARTAPRRAEINDGYQVNVELDVLYWRPEIENNVISQSASFPSSGDPGNVFLPKKGEVSNLNYRWNWGVRVGLGYDFKHDDWDLDLVYTYFNTHAKWNKGSGQNSYYTLSRGSRAVLPNDTRYSFATEVKGSGNFTYQNLDLMVGRDYFISSKLAFNPHFGLRSAWIEDNETVEYGGGNLIAPNGKEGFYGNNTKVIDKCKSWGIGPGIGVNTSWYLDRGFSIGANLNTALIYTSYKTRHDNHFSYDSEANVINVTNSFHQFTPMVDFFLGLKWETFFNKDKNYFDIALGWETQVWWDQIQRFQTQQGAGARANVSGTYVGRDLSMQGMTLKLMVSF